ncbi:MAG: hypothetical protein WCH46_09045 [bacterium]
MKKTTTFALILCFSEIFCGCPTDGLNDIFKPKSDPPEYQARKLLTFFGRKAAAPKGKIAFYTATESSESGVSILPGFAYDPERISAVDRAEVHNLELSSNSGFTLVFPKFIKDTISIGYNFNDRAKFQYYNSGDSIEHVFYSAVKITKYDAISKLVSGEFAVETGSNYYVSRPTTTYFGSFTDLPLDYSPTHDELPRMFQVDVTDTLGQHYSTGADQVNIYFDSHHSSLSTDCIPQNPNLPKMELNIFWTGSPRVGSYSDSVFEVNYGCIDARDCPDTYAMVGKELNSFVITSVNTYKKIISGYFSFQLYEIFEGKRKVAIKGEFTNLGY